jgi:hypothetical protein
VASSIKVLFQLGEKCIDIGITLAQGFNALNTVANCRMITTIVKAANDRGGPPTDVLCEIHGHLAIKASRLGVPQAARRTEARGDRGIDLRKRNAPMPT